MALNIGELTGTLSLDDKDWGQGIKSAHGDLDRLGSEGEKKSSKAGALVGGAIGAGLLMGAAKVQEFASGAVDAFAAVEDATGAAGVQFGAALPQVLEFADKASKSFGLSKRAALDSQNTFGTLGKAAGLAGAPLAGFAGQLSGLAGDLASFKGTSTEQAIDAVGAALRGESEPIRAYGVLLDEATVNQEALRMGLVKAIPDQLKINSARAAATLAQQKLTAVMKDSKSTDAEKASAQVALARAQDATKKATEGSIPPLTMSQKVMARQSAILRQTKDAQGDYNRTSSSTANVQKTLAAETENAQAKLGQKLAPAVTAVRTQMLRFIGSLSTAVDKTSALVGWAQKHEGALKTGAVAVGVITAAVLAHNFQMALASGRLKAWILQTTIVRGTTAVWAAGQWLLNAALTANPIGLVVAAIALLIGGIVLIATKTTWFQTIWKVMTGALGAAWQWMWNSILAPIIRFVLGGFASIVGGIANMLTVLSNIPGFGWAKTAADKMSGAAEKARALAAGVRDIPDRKTIDITARFTSVVANATQAAAHNLGAKAAFASGTDFAPGGMALVGERGPEILNVPRGAQVIPNHKIGAASDGATSADIKALGDRFAEISDRQARTIQTMQRQMAGAR